jgi:acetylornithine/succinyldiaminopimelate/putrescine aminotransferase
METLTNTRPGTLEQIAELERRYLLQTYNRYPIVLTRGKGVYLFDTEGKRYLDFVSGLGVNALGHAHPRIVKAIREQAAKLVHVSNLYYHEYQGRLAEVRSNWRGWPDTAQAARRRAGWWRWKGRITGARLAPCR